MNTENVALFLLEKLKEPVATELKAALLLLKHCPKNTDALDTVIKLLTQMHEIEKVPKAATVLELLREQASIALAVPHEAPVEMTNVPVEALKKQRRSTKEEEEKEEEEEEDEDQLASFYEQSSEEEETSDSEQWSVTPTDEEEEQEEEEETRPRGASPQGIIVISDNSSGGENKRKRQRPERFRHEDFEDDNSADKGEDIGTDKPSNGILSALSRCLKVYDDEGYDALSTTSWWDSHFGALLKGVEDGCGRSGNADFIKEKLRDPCLANIGVTFEEFSPHRKANCSMCNGTHECSVRLIPIAASPALAAGAGEMIPPKDKEEESPSILLGAYCADVSKKLYAFYQCLRDHDSLNSRREKYQKLKQCLSAVVEAHAAKRRK